MAGKILVVDDDAEVREALGLNLSEEGYPVLTALNGAEALRVLEHETPALILLDLTMPHMDGQAFWEHLQRTKPDIAVVVISAVGHRAPKGLAVLEKPIDFERLMDHVRQHCGSPDAVRAG